MLEYQWIGDHKYKLIFEFNLQGNYNFAIPFLKIGNMGQHKREIDLEKNVFTYAKHKMFCHFCHETVVYRK